VSAIIMPFGLLTLATMPFGLETAPLAVMASGIDGLLAVSDWVAQLPGADMAAPPLPAASLLLVSFGLVWLCLWRREWRVLGAPVVVAGLALAPFTSRPADILVAPDGLAVAIRDPAGVLRVSGSRAGSYVIDQFYDEEPGPALTGDDLREGIRCDELGCLASTRSRLLVAHARDPAALLEDCVRADIIVTPLTVPRSCAAPLMIDGPRLSRLGAHAVRVREHGEFAVTTARGAFARPWQAGWGREF
jgi:competence protein ComEC